MSVYVGEFGLRPAFIKTKSKVREEQLTLPNSNFVSSFQMKLREIKVAPVSSQQGAQLFHRKKRGIIAFGKYLFP
jgi:hypothetical protein